MTHQKYGKKFTCFHCETKFYNLGAPKPICPKCGSNQKKAPKKQVVKTGRRADVPEPESEEESPTESTDDFPVKEEAEESFDPEKDSMSVDATPDQEY